MTVERWLTALEERHLVNLTTSEVTRALRALSSCYVERREKLSTGAALDGAGKRAAFALFYGPQHFVIARAIAEALGERLTRGVTRVMDLGCGTGSAGAAVALASNAAIEGFDLNRWAADEASWTYRALALTGRARPMNLSAVRMDGQPGELLLGAWAMNELPDALREQMLARLLAAHARGSAVLIIEPIGRRANPWWTSWSTAVVERGGQDDDWRFHDLLPPRQRAFAKAAGLDVQVQTARSLLLPGSARRPT